MSKDDRGRIVPLQFIADRRVLGGIPGGGEVAIGRDDPRSRKHALPRHATASASTFHGRFGATHSSSVAGHGTPMHARSGRKPTSVTKVRTIGASPEYAWLR